MDNEIKELFEAIINEFEKLDNKIDKLDDKIESVETNLKSELRQMEERLTHRINAIELQSSANQDNITNIENELKAAL